MAKVLLAVLLACFAMMVSAKGGLAGGTSPVDVSDPGVLSAAEHVLSAANSPAACSGLCAGLRENSEVKLVKVVSASTQVVAGVLYKLELLVSDAAGKQSLVTTSVWSRPWLAAKNDATEPATKITQLAYTRVEGAEA